jgi:hypothetical protein
LQVHMLGGEMIGQRDQLRHGAVDNDRTLE